MADFVQAGAGGRVLAQRQHKGQFLQLCAGDAVKVDAALECALHGLKRGVLVGTLVLRAGRAVPVELSAARLWGVHAEFFYRLFGSVRRVFGFFQRAEIVIPEPNARFIG